MTVAGLKGVWRMGVDGLYIKRHGGLTFVSRRPLLHQLACEIALGLPAGFRPARNRVVVHCGAHKRIPPRWLMPGFRLAIQTEQLVDENGQRLWGSDMPEIGANLTRAIRDADLFLDLNPANRSYYQQLGLPADALRKLAFGPFIFPDHPPPFSPGTSGKIAFFGNTGGARRGAILSGIAEFKVQCLAPGTYGKPLYAALQQAEAVLNIHFQDGLYTEAPRLLTALLCGKPVASELLAPPFVEGVHYLALGNYDRDRLDPVFRQFAAFTARELSFAGFLRQHGV